MRGPLIEKKLLNEITQFDALLCGDDEITRNVIKKGALEGNLKAISKYGIGLDKIDIEAAKDYNIKITNCPGVNKTTVAEHVFALLLSFVKNIFKGLHFASKSPNRSPKIGIQIHSSTYKISGAIEVLASSLPINPGAISNKKIIKPKNFPTKVCSLLNSFSSTVKIDSFQEIFKNTNVKIITHAETFNIMSKGIGRSP